MIMRVYHYPRCSTCRKAVSWLEAHGVEHELVDIVVNPPGAAVLAEVLRKSGLELKKLFNTSGEVYRRDGYKERLKTMSEQEALNALAADGKLIKRPLLLGDELALVGFREASYAAALL